MSGTPVYWDYLKLAELLSLQGGLENDEDQLLPDELHFILVHQVSELWFKLVLRELRMARDELENPVPEERVPLVVHHLNRVNAILKLCVDSFEVMETLTPQDFLDFRDKLIPASGFQSFQMREVEILLGLEETTKRHTYGKADAMEHIRALAEHSPAGAMAWKRITSAREELTLRGSLHRWLYRTPIEGSTPDQEGDAQVVADFVDRYLAGLSAMHASQFERMKDLPDADPEGLAQKFAGLRKQASAYLHAEDAPEADRQRLVRIRTAVLFLESYRHLPLLSWPRTLVDTVVELEEQLVLWRHRHARMVERTIGRRIGTGGSSGVEYLDLTTGYRVFRELWAARTLLLPRAYLPPLNHPDFYGFAG